MASATTRKAYSNRNQPKLKKRKKTPEEERWENFQKNIVKILSSVYFERRDIKTKEFQDICMTWKSTYDYIQDPEKHTAPRFTKEDFLTLFNSMKPSNSSQPRSLRPRPHGYDIFESATFSFRIQKHLRPHLRNQIEFSCPHEYDGIRIYSST